MLKWFRGWTGGDWFGFIGGNFGILASIFAGLSWHEARVSRDIAVAAQTLSQKTYDRAAGLIPAKLSIIGYVPDQAEIDSRFKKKFLGVLDELYLRSLDTLRHINPRLYVRNDGDEPIDQIRIETQFFAGFIDALENPQRAAKAKTAWVSRQAERDDYELSGKLNPGDEAEIPIARGLLGQLLQAQNPELADYDHLGSFSVKCYGRLVGAQSFDATPVVSSLVVKFAWSPKGFPLDLCEKELSIMKPAVEIHRAATHNLPTPVMP